MIYLSVIIVSLIILLRFLGQWYTYWSRQGLRGPLFVDYQMASYVHQDYIEMSAKKYGKIYGSYSLLQRILVVNDPEVVKEVLLTRFNDCHSHRDFNLAPFLANSVFTVSKKEDWKRIRSIISPAFSTNKIKKMIPKISEVTGHLIANLKKYEQNGQVVDLVNHISGYTLDVITVCSYGLGIECVNNLEHPLLLNLKRLLSSDITINKIISLLLPKVARLFRIQFFDEISSNYLKDMTKHIINLRKYSDSKPRKDFFQMMMNSKIDNPVNPNNQDKTTKYLSENEVIGSGIMFLFAGSDTVATTLLHGLYHLAQNKDCQQILYEELKDIEDLSYEVLTQLKYLNAVINETLRMSTPVNPITRRVNKDLVLKGINVPAGTVILIHPHAIHTDPDYWPDPLTFNPQRFIDGTHKEWTYLPFAGGPRICIGYQFALTELRMCLAKLITNFEFTLAPGFHKLDFYIGNVINIPKTLKLNIQAR